MAWKHRYGMGSWNPSPCMVNTMTAGEWTRVWATILFTCPDTKVHEANMGPTGVLSVPDGPHVGPMNLAISVVKLKY